MAPGPPPSPPPPRELPCFSVVHIVFFQEEAKARPIYKEETSEKSSDYTSAATSQQIFDEYLTFCQMRKLDSKKCDVTWINIFFTSIRVNLKPAPNELVEALGMIGRHHVQQVPKYSFQLCLG